MSAADQLLWLRYGTLTVFGLLFGGFAFYIGLQPVRSSPRLGNRGLKRKEALSEGGPYSALEPLLRLVGTWVGRLPILDARRALDTKLIHAGDWLGLTPDEYIAMCIVSVVSFTSIVGFVVAKLKLDSMFYLLGPIFGYFWPRSRLDGEVALRFKQVDRSLPIAIDLASLCMGAGLDFPAALRQYVEKAGVRDALHAEFIRILQELELGRTRKQALENFAERAPTDSVKDFVSSVVQAEEKGTPLAEVLRIQANMLRMRRSVLAEESAARAAVMLLGPLMLIFCAIILVLMGPFIVQAMKSGM